MPVIYKQIIKEIIKHFIVILLTVIGIYLAVDFFEKIDDFIEAGLPFAAACRYFLFKIPFVVAQITPVGVLLSVLIAFGMMNRRNEIIALKSGGVSVYSLLKPVASAGFVACFFLFFMSEAIVPITMSTANRIWFEDVRKETGLVSNKKNIWIKNGRGIVNIKHYDTSEKLIFGVTANEFDKNFSLIRRVDAAKGEYVEDKVWLLYDIMKQEVAPDGNQEIKFYKKKREDLGFLPSDIKRIAKKSEEMNFLDLYNYIKKIESEGYDATNYRVDLYAKFSFPLVCLIMCLIGAGIGLKKKMKDGLAAGVGYGIGAAFCYWVFYSFCVSLGYGKMLSPVIAVVAANMVFLSFGIYMTLNAE